MSNSVSRQTTNHVPEPVARVADAHVHVSRALGALRRLGGRRLARPPDPRSRRRRHLGLRRRSACPLRSPRRLAAGARTISTTHTSHGTAGTSIYPTTSQPAFATTAPPLPDVSKRRRSAASISSSATAPATTGFCRAEPRISLPLRNGIQAVAVGSAHGRPRSPALLQGHGLLRHRGANDGRSLPRRARLPCSSVPPDRRTAPLAPEAISVVHPGHPWLSQLSP